MAAPANPPIRVCEEEDGIPFHQVTRFQVIAAIIPAYLMGWNNKTNANFDKKYLDRDVFIIQREKNKMSSKEQTKLMDLIRTNFDEYNWDEDDSGDIE